MKTRNEEIQRKAAFQLSMIRGLILEFICDPEIQKEFGKTRLRRLTTAEGILQDVRLDIADVIPTVERPEDIVSHGYDAAKEVYNKFWDAYKS